MRFNTIIVYCFFIVTIYQTVVGLPLTPAESKSKAKRDSFGFPSNVQVEETRPNNSCYEFDTIQRIELVRSRTDPSVYINETRNITVRRCCTGYTGEECNITVDPYSASNPCNGLSCPNFPNAVCAVITQCGQDRPVFLDEEGDIVECDSQESKNITTTLSCIGYCVDDPCANLTCSKYPSAICLTIGCTCQPIWLLETGVSVDCDTGDIIPPETQRKRRRRQVDAIESCSR